MVEDSRFCLTKIKIRDCKGYQDRYRGVFKNKEELKNNYNKYRLLRLGTISVEGILNNEFIDLTLRVNDKKIIADTNNNTDITSFLNEMIKGK